MAHHYKVYGLSVAVNKPLRLLASTHHSNPDVSIDLSNQHASKLYFITEAQPESTDKDIRLWRTPNWVCIEYPRSSDHALRFFIRSDGSEVISDKPDAIPTSDLESFILGPILGCVLRLKQYFCLHASVLEFNGKAFAMIGHKGAGKSTTAAALLHAGARLVSDDVAVLQKIETGQPIVYPGYPGIRLLPDTLSKFTLSKHDYNKVVSSNDKRIIPLPVTGQNIESQLDWQFQPCPHRLDAIYTLAPRQAHLTRPQITTLAQRQACIALTPHGYGRRVLNKDQQNQEFVCMAKLVRSIPVKSVACPNKLEYLAKIADNILIDLDNIA